MIPRYPIYKQAEKKCYQKSDSKAPWHQAKIIRFFINNEKKNTYWATKHMSFSLFKLDMDLDCHFSDLFYHKRMSFVSILFCFFADISPNSQKIHSKTKNSISIKQQTTTEKKERKGSKFVLEQSSLCELISIWLDSFSINTKSYRYV